MSEKQKLVPKLRFPEFREAGEWSKEKLGTVATLHKGKGISKAEIVAKGVQPCIRYGELYTIYGETIHETASSTNVDASELFLSKKNDVIIPASGETKIDIAKASCVMKDDIALGGDLNVIRSSQNGIFLSYQLNGPLRSSIARVAQGDSVVHLYPTQIERLDVLVPSPPEQQKIADCLASLDELITLKSQKLDTLKTHKKGLMQQLFPAEGETLPKRRFPEFRDAGEWGIYKIGDFVESYKGGASLTPNDFVTKSDYEVIPKKAICEGAWLKIDTANVTYCTEDFYNNNNQSIIDCTYLITTLRDLVPSGPSIGYIVKYRGDKKYVLAQGVYGLKPKEEFISDFLIHFSNTIHYRKLVNAIMVGSTQVHIRNGEFLNLPINVPSIKEQQKIADCLTSLDDRITAQTQQLAALKTHKKGLMQQLFPVLDEVQG